VKRLWDTNLAAPKFYPPKNNVLIRHFTSDWSVSLQNQLSVLVESKNYLIIGNFREDFENGIRPLNDRVIVKRHETENVSAGGKS